jgi:hypothetical protein
MKSRKGTAPPQSAPTIPSPAPAKPSGKATQRVSAPHLPAPSKAPPAPKPQATTSKLPTAPATPVKASKASAAPAAPAAASAPQVQRSAPPQPVSGPTKPVPFNAMPRAAARPAPKPVNEPAKALPQIKPVIPQPSAAVLRSVPRSVLQDAEELAAQPVHLHRVGAKPAPAPPTAANPVPVVEHAALGRLAPKAAPPAPAQTPTSARQLAQEPSAAPVRAETFPVTKKLLGRPRKAAVLAFVEVVDILQVDLLDTRFAVLLVLA